MLRSFKSFISLFLSCALVATPTYAHGEGSAPKDLQALSPEEKVQDIYDLLRPTRKSETVSETFYRLSVRLDDEEQLFLSKKIGKHGLLKSPKVSLKNNTIIIADQGKEIRLTYVENKKNGISILVNGQALTQAEIDSPALRWNRLEDVLKEQGLKAQGSPLMRLFLPEVHAFSWWMLLGVAGAAAAAFILYKKNKKSSQVKCSDSTSSCCVVNGTYTMHSNACCQEISGLGMGSGAVCPSTTPVAVPLSVPTNSSGQH